MDACRAARMSLWTSCPLPLGAEALAALLAALVLGRDVAAVFLRAGPFFLPPAAFPPAFFGFFPATFLAEAFFFTALFLEAFFFAAVFFFGAFLREAACFLRAADFFRPVCFFRAAIDPIPPASRSREGRGAYIAADGCAPEFWTHQ
jgi:hypothetical protein